MSQRKKIEETVVKPFEEMIEHLTAIQVSDLCDPLQTVLTSSLPPLPE